MTEIDLVQAYYGAINLAYTTSTWWITVSTALVVATYFAGKHIPIWLFTMTIILYLLSSASAVFELNGYSQLALSYGARLFALHAPGHVVGNDASSSGAVNVILNCAVIVLGTISASAFAFVTWRGARVVAHVTANGKTSVIPSKGPHAE